MMDERELDRAIDTAAGRMMAQEPRRALGYTVMARVRQGTTPAPRRFVWIVATASLVLCGVITIAVMTRAPSPALSLPVSRQLAVGHPPVAPALEVSVVAEGAMQPRRVARAPIQRGVVRPPVPLTPADMSVIEPIETEPIVLSEIDVPQLAREATSIETLNIEPLTIEPLAASND